MWLHGYRSLLGSRFPLVRFLFDRPAYPHALKKSASQPTGCRSPAAGSPCAAIPFSNTRTITRKCRPQRAAPTPTARARPTPSQPTRWQNARFSSAYSPRSLASCLPSHPPRLLPDYPHIRRADVPESLYYRHLRPLIAPRGRAPNQAV